MNTYEPRPREKAMELLEAYILEHRLQPGDSLPTEREMCRMWGVNRMTLRSAIAGIEASGRIFAVQGSGTRMKRRFRRTLQNLHGFTEDAIACGFHPETRLLSFSVVECDKHLSRRFHRMLGEKLYRISRLRILDGVPTMIETSYIPVECAPGLEEHDIVSGSLYRILSEVYHLDLDHGVEKASLTLATEEEARLLQIEPGEAAFWIVAQTDNAKGETIEYCRAVGRADIIEMASTLRWAETEGMKP